MRRWNEYSVMAEIRELVLTFLERLSHNALPENRKRETLHTCIERRNRSRCRGSKILDDNKPIKSLKSLFALFQTLPILFSFIQFGKSWRNFLWDLICCYLSLEKESDNFCVVFTFSIKRCREIRKFHVVVVQRRQRNVQNSVMHVQSWCLLILTYYFSPFSLPSPSSLVLMSSRNSATMVTWRHTSPLY